MKRFMNKKLLVVGVVVAVLLGVGGAAFAFFGVGGSGSGTAKVGTASDVTISQIGAGYDSLITGSGDPYIQDQCLACVSITDLGNDITLANTGYQQLVNVVVAMRNWGAGAITDLPMTLSINKGVAGPITDTQSFSFPPAIIAGVEPSLTNVTFDFSSQGAFVAQEFVYDISFSATSGSWGDASGLNVALSSSATDLSIGTDTNTGYLYVDPTDNGSGWHGDAPNCGTLTTGIFQSVQTDCGPAVETDAYGTPAQVAAGNADIPAVEVNVVGGTTASLWPGETQPLGFAITNPNTGDVWITTVTIAPKTNVSGDVEDQYSDDITGCLATWFTVNGSPVSIAGNVAPGVTLFQNVASITMSNPNTSQNACEGHTIGLSFTSP